MLPIITDLQTQAAAAAKHIFDLDLSPEIFVVQETKKEFEGDYTIVVFPLTKYKLGSPVQIGEKIGAYIQENMPLVKGFGVIQGFLNISLDNNFWKAFLVEHQHDDTQSHFFNPNIGNGKRILVEHCSPNTNKPLHLGHLRNLMLGDAIVKLYQAAGYEAVPCCLYNDRGTAICKSMYAWQQRFAGITPETYTKHPNKGDKLIGDCYVEFSHILEEEVAALVAGGMAKEEAEKNAPCMLAINDMLIRWEQGDAEIRALWKQMNDWVYAANQQVFDKLHIHFDRFYYESDLYESGRDIVKEGLEKGIFETKENGAVGIDLTQDGLDFKVLIRSNGTTVYMTQDLGTADQKYADYGAEKSVYVVGNEQDYHFKVLFLIMKKLGRSYAEGMYHLSYGMVDLPSGKMKSREGTTVEADDLISEVKEAAKAKTIELGKVEGMTDEDLLQLSEILGLGALKFFLLKVDPQKRMLFDPKESVEINGHTGPFIQYSYTRTASVKRKSQDLQVAPLVFESKIEEVMTEYEKNVVKMIYRYPEVLHEAAHTYNPSLIANYAYELTKEYNRFYHECKILVPEKPNLTTARFAISNLCGQTIKKCLELLGIEVPERM